MGGSGSYDFAQALKAKEEMIRSTISTSHNLPPPSPSPRPTGPPGDRRESLTLFQKLNQGDTGVSTDSTADERNDDINDPIVKYDEELLKRVQKQAQSRASSSIQVSNTNTTPLASQKSPQSQSNLKKRALTAPRSPKTIRKESPVQHRYYTRSSAKNFPSSSLGSRPKLPGRRSASTSSPPKTPTRRTVTIAPLPSRFKEYLPEDSEEDSQEDSQEDDATHSPPELNSANVPASGKEDRKGKSVLRNSQPAKDEPKPDSKGKSKDDSKPDSESAFDAHAERIRRLYDVPLTPVEKWLVKHEHLFNTPEDVLISEQTWFEYFFCRTIYGRKRLATRELWALTTPSEDPATDAFDWARTQLLARAKYQAGDEASSSTPAAEEPTEEPAEEPTEKPADKQGSSLNPFTMGKNFFSKVQDALAGSKNEEVPDKEKLPPPAAEEQEDQVPDEEKVPPPAAEEKEDQATDKEKTPAPATEEKEEQGLDKENSPAGLGDLKPFIARLPTFGESNEPIKRRHTDSYKRATTPEPLKENKPTSKSAEANKTTNDWFAVTPSNENVLQPFQARSPFTERRLNRNLLEDFKASIPTSTAASDDKPASSNTSRKRKLEGQKEEGRATYSRFKK